MKGLYDLGIFIYVLLIRLAAPFNSKASKWLNGRKNWASTLSDWRKKHPGELVWIHCASLGEFEQGRPLIEAIKSESPGKLILLSFFSPSGYEVRKNYTIADGVVYLPADTKRNAKRWFEILKPAEVVFVKYEYWANYFFQCKNLNVPLYMVSAILRKDQRFFGWASSFWNKVLGCVTHFFVQNQTTCGLLDQLGFNNYTLSGDTRFDRVFAISKNANAIPEVEIFKGDSICIVAGSSWPEEESMLRNWFGKIKKEYSSAGIKLVIVPHDIHQDQIQKLKEEFPSAVTWTDRNHSDLTSAKVLIVDAVGFLSGIYRYADLAIIGGGFGKGIHNILEAAVFGAPVMFGPKFQKFDEAVQLIKMGGAVSVNNTGEFENVLNNWTKDFKLRNEMGRRAADFVQQGTGATEIVLSGMRQKNR